MWPLPGPAASDHFHHFSGDSSDVIPSKVRLSEPIQGEKHGQAAKKWIQCSQCLVKIWIQFMKFESDKKNGKRGIPRVKKNMQIGDSGDFVTMKRSKSFKNQDYGPTSTLHVQGIH